MRSVNSNIIEIQKSRKVGPFPQYILLGHRHLEKAPPPQVGEHNAEASVTIPVDLLSVPTRDEEGILPDGKKVDLKVQVVDPILITGIESITLYYRRK